MLLFHGSSENLESLTVRAADVFDVFDGIFCSASKTAAQSFGDYIYVIDIPDDNILTESDILTLSQDEETAKKLSAAVAKATGCAEENPNFALFFEILCYEQYDMFDDIWPDLIPYKSTPGEIGWELQNLRGKMAAILGFRAVTMHDETGTSYFVVPGAVLKNEALFESEDRKEEPIACIVCGTKKETERLDKGLNRG